MLKIAFHTPQIDVRGACIAIYDYAYYNQELLGNSSLITIPKDSINEIPAMIKFSKQFYIYWYKNNSDLEKFLLAENIDIFYCIKHGQKDNLCFDTVPTVIHCVFDLSYPHGKVHAAVSETLAKKFGKNIFVPHMISLKPSKTKENLRKTLNIPETSIVFGRYGGMDTFDLEFVRNAIKDIITNRKDVYFLFINTPRFVDHSRVIFLDKIANCDEKNRFILTCDAHIEAGSLGHSFGLSIGEFSVNNKPIIAYNGPMWNRAHIEILGTKGLYYSNEREFHDIINRFEPEDYEGKDLNCYKEYSPEIVMKKFKEVFIDPLSRN